MPFVVIGDEGFPMKTNLMHPYPGKNLEEAQAIFNYRLSRARRVIDYDSMVASLQAPHHSQCHECDPLHQGSHSPAQLRSTESTVYCPPGYVDGEDGVGNMIPGNWKRDVEESCDGLNPIGQVGGNRYT